MLTAQEIAAMRQTLTASLPEQAQIQRPGQSADGLGGVTESWTTVATVACRRSPAQQTAQEQLIAESVRPRVLWRLTLPANTDIRPADRVQLGAVRYTVQGVLAPRSEELAVIALVLREE